MNKWVGCMYSSGTRSTKAFTIVELLVVIVVIGILAAVTIVSYSGIRERAVAASIKAQLKENSKILKMFHVDHDIYPATLDAGYCPATPVVDNRYCLKNMSGANLTYTGSAGSFTLTIEKSNISYQITESDNIAQTPSSTGAESFATAWGGVGADYVSNVIQTSDDGYVVVGDTDSFGSGDVDATLIKYNKSGSLSWNKKWGGSGGDWAKAVIQTSDGGYTVAGSTDSFGAGNVDAFLTRYDQSGNLSWSKTWGGTSQENGYDIVQASDGGYVVVGYTYSFGAGDSDAFLAKYDQSGNLSWSRTWGGANSDSANSIIRSSDNGYVISGYTDSYGAGNNDAFIAKYDQSGNLSWSRTWGSGGFDKSMGLIQTSDGGYAISGNTDAYGEGYFDAFIAKYDQSGNLSWSRTWGGVGYETSEAITQASDGGVVINGSTDSYGAGGEDSFVAKYDQSGNLSWSNTWGSSTSDNGFSVDSTRDGGYVVVAFTSFGAGSSDLSVIKYKSDGLISNCSSPMCQSPVIVVSSPVATVSSPSATTTNPLATVTSPVMTPTSPIATTTVLLAPI